VVQAIRRHGDHDVEEEAQEQIFQAAQGDIEPAGQGEVAAKEFVAELPEILGDRAHGAEPGAEGLFQQQAR
jgi:hypothetical protein